AAPIRVRRRCRPGARAGDGDAVRAGPRRPELRAHRFLGSATVVRAALADVLRPLAPQVLAVLVRWHGRFEAREDAVQEAPLAASARWPAEGGPDNPRARLLTVASRRPADHWR